MYLIMISQLQVVGGGNNRAGWLKNVFGEMNVYKVV
jgi:hypothetical protein